MSDLMEFIAKQINSKLTSEEVNSILAYHFSASIDTLPKTIKEQLERCGANFNRFNKPVQQEEKAAAPEVDVNALTKMVVDKPIVKTSKAKNNK